MKLLLIARWGIVLCVALASLAVKPITFAADSRMPLMARQNQTTGKLIRTIRKQLPQGWTVTYESQNYRLEITRITPVRMIVYEPNMSEEMFEEAGKGKNRGTFRLAFLVVPYVSPAEYRRQKAANGEIGVKLQSFYRKLAFQQHISHKYDYFLPQTQDEKAQVAEYNRMKDSETLLPDFYYRDISLVWEEGLSALGYRYFSVDEKPAQQECEAVTQKVTHLLSQY